VTCTDNAGYFIGEILLKRDQSYQYVFNCCKICVFSPNVPLSLLVNVLRMSDALPVAGWLMEVKISIFKCLLVLMGW
jgi:hypothetical protein